MASELRKLYEADPDAKRVIDVARGLEGLRRQDGIHAAAVVITREPLTEYLPIQRKPEPGGDLEARRSSRSTRCTASKTSGLLKMDFLGLRNLDVLEITLELVERATGHPPRHRQRPARRPQDVRDAAPGRHHRRVPARRWAGARAAAVAAPTTFEDVAALVALYRPGPMAQNWHNEYADRKNGRKPVNYPHPDLEEILAPTYGLMIYQEQLMRVAQRLAGYSLEEADNLRKATGKKIRALIAKERSKFVDGCVAQGHDARVRREDLRHDRAVRRLLVQQVALGRLRLRRVPDRVPEGEPPGRVPRGAAHERQDQQGPDRGLPQRVPPAGHRGARARRQRVGVGLLGGCRRRQRVRSASACRRCATSARAWSRTSWPPATRAGRSPTSTTSASASTRWRSTSGRSSRWSRRAASTRSGIPARGSSSCSSRSSTPPSPAGAKRGRGPVRASSASTPTTPGRQPSTPPHRDPRRRVPEGAAPRVREGDARPLRERAPAAGRRAGAAPLRRLHAHRAQRKVAKARCARSAASSPRWPASTPSAATSWPRSCSRTSAPRSR